MKRFFNVAFAAMPVLVAIPAAAQRSHSLDLTINNAGLSIGDSRRVSGLRINFRDRNMEEVNGINATIWTPYEESRGDVRGIALGIPLTGARQIDGIAAGLFGVGAHETIRGIAVGGIGLGAGEDIRGIAIGGIGMGAGRDFVGLGIGGIGAGFGSDIKGVAIGGIGVGAGRNATGILIGGVGAGVGGDLKGLSIAGVGVGAGGKINGLTITGVGLGAGGDVTGVQIAGLGIGAGGTLKWVSLSAGGIGAPRIEGVAIASAVGGQDVRGLVVAPFYFRIANGGRVTGVNVSAFNHVTGIQQGLAIGIFNFARTLDGMQIGLLNYAGNKSRGTRLLPIVNYARAR
jgi:hypothetical protein